MKILNLTQHAATAAQVAAGVVDLDPAQRVILAKWLTFDTCPSGQGVADRAGLIAQAAADDSRALGPVLDDRNQAYSYAMIGGAPFLMSALENALIQRGCTPLYAFSVRESVETVQEDGSVVKTAVFNHGGFVQI